MAHEPEHEQGSGHGLAVETSRPEVARPPLFQVVLLNDDFTPMDFVVEVLRSFFNLDQERAVLVHGDLLHLGLPTGSVDHVLAVSVPPVWRCSPRPWHPLPARCSPMRTWMQII